MTTDQQARRTSLALRYGTALPKPKKPRLEAPGFFLGSVESPNFSPDGRYLFVPTLSGAFLWGVRERCQLARLRGLANAQLLAFSPDRRRLLLHDGAWKYAWFSIPDGELIEKFSANYPYGQFGSACLGPDESLLHLSYEGRFVMFDAGGQRCLLERRLDPSGYDGAIHWFPTRQEVWITQASLHHNPNSPEPPGWPCALWRWRWPLVEHEPERLPGSWCSLHSVRAPNADALWLHHKPDGAASDSYRLDRLDLDTGTVVESIPCAGNTVPRPGFSHDGKPWAVGGREQTELCLDGRHIRLPAATSSATFSPTEDLLALSGPAGMVVPREKIPSLIETLQAYDDERELQMRGYGRHLSLPGKVLAPRIVIYAREGRWLIQSERAQGSLYVPLSQPLELAETIADAHIMQAIEMAHQRSRCGEEEDEPTTPNERRGLVSARHLTPPTPGWHSAVAVVFADDAIDLWPMKPVKEQGFIYAFYPVASIPPDSDGPQLLRAIRAMLRIFRPRCG